MATHALVVGCDAYPDQPGGDLSGAVRDALAFRDWLLDRQVGGGVEERDLVFLASASQAGAQPTCPTNGPAGRGELADAVLHLMDRTDVSSGDVLYLYFAGHGLRTDPTNPQLARDVLATTDFRPTDPAGGCVAVLDLVTRLEQSSFGSVVVFLDACRDFPFRRPFQVGGLGLDPEPRSARHRAPRVFRMHGTHAGGTAEGSAVHGAMRGDFTVALIAGLEGAGTAKRFDETATPPYRVTWHSLVAHVEAKLPALGPLGREGGELTLATFPDGWFDEVSLTVQVEPAVAIDSEPLEVSVRHVAPSAFEDAEVSRPGPAPVDFSVPPRRQVIRARAGQLWGKRTVDVYEQLLVTVPLTSGGPPRTAVPPGEDIVRGRADRVGVIDARSEDPALLIEVRSLDPAAAGLSGIGEVRGSLAAGSYTLWLTGARGRTESLPVEVEAGDETVLSLETTAPRRGVTSLDDEDPNLRWASDAAVVAARTAVADIGMVNQSSPSAARPVVVVAGDGAASHGWASSPFGPPVRVEAQVFTSGATPLRRFAPSGEHWFTLDVDGHMLTVPVHPSAVTAVVLEASGVSLGVFDRTTLEDPLATLLVDRAQVLLGLGLHEAVRPLLDRAAQRRMGGLVSHLLYRAADRDLHRGEQGESSTLSAARPATDAAYALSPGPWATLVDYPYLMQLGRFPTERAAEEPATLAGAAAEDSAGAAGTASAGKEETASAGKEDDNPSPELSQLT